MTSLPDDVAAAIARGVAAFVRDSRPAELPARLRPIQKVTHDRALARHREALLAALDDEPMRARILEWLDDRPPLRRSDVDLVRIACERPEGWEDRLAGRSIAASRSGPAVDERVAELETRLRSERRRARGTRRELSAVKEAREREDRARRAETARLSRSIGDLAKRAERAEAQAKEAMARAERAADEVRRERRRARREADEADDSMRSLKGRVRELVAENRELRHTVADLTDQLERMRNARRRRVPKAPGAPEARTPLPVPPGLFEDSPETLEAWLKSPAAVLLVDGYNVTKSEGGFGDLTLEYQRRILVDNMAALVRRYGVEATIVFDGSRVAPGTSRRSRGRVKVEYSKPNEIADDHLIAKLESMPPHPVIVVTNDRELQERASALGATLARSGQLLALIR
jgi:predicted RNA-binding protein with PIN domain